MRTRQLKIRASYAQRLSQQQPGARKSSSQRQGQTSVPGEPHGTMLPLKPPVLGSVCHEDCLLCSREPPPLVPLTHAPSHLSHSTPGSRMSLHHVPPKLSLFPGHPPSQVAPAATRLGPLPGSVLFSHIHHHGALLLNASPSPT